MKEVEFKKYTLKDVCEILKGQQFKNSSYKEQGIPVIKVANIKEGKIDRKKIDYVDPNEFSKAHILGFGDIVLSITHPIGKVAINLSEEKFLFDSHTFKLFPREDILDKKYFYYFLLNSRHKIESLASSLNLPTLKKSSLESLSISLPDLNTQKDIVKKLDTFTELKKELKKELSLRKKQHNYYRGKIINCLFEDISNDIK